MRAWHWALWVLLAMHSNLFLYGFIAYVAYLVLRKVKWPRAKSVYPEWNTMVHKSACNKHAVYCVLRQLSRYDGHAGVARAVNKYTWIKDAEIRSNWFDQRAEFCARRFSEGNYTVRQLPYVFGNSYDVHVPSILKLPKDTLSGLYRVASAGAILNWSNTNWISFHAERTHGKVRVSKYFGKQDVLFVMVGMSRGILYLQKVPSFDILRE